MKRPQQTISQDKKQSLSFYLFFFFPQVEVRKMRFPMHLFNTSRRLLKIPTAPNRPLHSKALHLFYNVLHRIGYTIKKYLISTQCQRDAEYVPSPNYRLHKPRSHSSVSNKWRCTSQLECALGTRGQLTNDITRQRA